MECGRIGQSVYNVRSMRIRSQFFKKEYELSKAELIGEGNFAQVFRAFDSDLNDSIAIRKVKKNQADLDDINKEKQINEELRKVDNENILKIYDIIDQQDAVWYITEYCSGGSLWDALNLCKDNKMTEKEGLECVLQISKGVQELHNHRITHRDLKPENILLKTKYVPNKPLPLIKLADFGLSTQKIIMETIAGTKEYIAPEQAKFHNYTNAVDVWSLGIIFDEILHGTPFYSGEDNKQVFSKILKMPFKIRDENLRNSVKQLLISLLKKKPYQRPIIAVIRSTIERILEEIEGEHAQKQETTAQKNRKHKQNHNNSINQSIRSSNGGQTNAISNNSPKENTLGIHSRRVYELNKQEQKPKGYFKKQITPNNRAKIAKVEDDSKNLSLIANRSEAKEAQKVTTINEIREKVEKQIDKIQPKQEKPQKTIESPKQQSKQQDLRSTDRSQPSRIQSLPSATKLIPAASPLPPINEKITIYKVDRRKMITSNVKKEQLHSELVDLSTYMQRVAASKKQLLDRQLKLDKQHSFLPNTYLSGADFVQKCGKPEEALRTFKKKYDYLNYFSVTEDYEIKVIRGESELKNNRKECQEQIAEMRETVREIFLGQLDSFVEQYVEKVLK